MLVNHRENPTFNPVYIFSGREDDSERVQNPAVAVYGTGDPSPFLGVGRIIGSIQRPYSERSSLNVPCAVIEVEDIEDGQPYTLLETQAWREYPIPSQLIEDMLANTIAVTSVRTYLEMLNG